MPPQGSDAGPRVALVSVDAVGHINPMLAIGAALTEHADSPSVMAFGPKHVANAFVDAGLDFNAFSDRHALDGATDLVLRAFIRPLDDIASVLDQMRAFAPDIVVYDCFSIYGWLAARELEIPGIMLLTWPGYGALGDRFIQAHQDVRPNVAQANRQYADRFGFDFLANGYLPVFFPADRTIVTTVESLALPIDRQRQPLTFARFGRFEAGASYVGTCSSKRNMSPSNIRGVRTRTHGGTLKAASDGEPPFPFEQLDLAKQQSKSILLMSFGTVIPFSRFENAAGGAASGREYMLSAIKMVTAAIADDPDMLLIVATGLLLDLEDDLPPNIIARQFIPQRDLLQNYVDVFVTHHGANSQTESLEAGVPMISWPGLGDEIPNARILAERGAALAYWALDDPVGTCTPAAMRRAIHEVLREESYRDACAALRDELRAAKGPETAANLIVGHALGQFASRT